MPPRADPFWLCHECGAQMRPLVINGVNHCASCNGEFIEILDSEVNPDPFHDLPPPPPVRPQSSPPIPTSNSPLGSSSAQTQTQTQAPGFLQSLLGMFGGEESQQPVQNAQSRSPGSPRQRQQQDTPGTRTWSFNVGGGSGSITFGTMTSNTGMPFNPFMPLGSPSNRQNRQGQGQGQGGMTGFPFDAFPEFPPYMGHGQGPGQGQGDPFAGQDMLRALIAALSEDGAMPMFPPGRMGDYATSQQSFDQILEQLMQAAGPQGPLPASNTVIEGLPKFKLDEETLEKSQFKDCPICKDDFTTGEEVMRIPCKHIFHPDCLEPWLKVNGSCPVCRFSLVPEGETHRPRSAPPQPAPTQTQTGSETAPPSDWQSTISNTLNRLFGQTGSNPASPTTEMPPSQRTTTAPGASQSSSNSQQRPPVSNSPSSHNQPSSAGGNASTQRNQQTSGNISEPASHSPASTSSAPSSPPVIVTTSSAIPEDYRARHREREQRQHEYGDDLD